MPKPFSEELTCQRPVCNRDLPLADLAAFACSASESNRCAGAQVQHWQAAQNAVCTIFSSKASDSSTMARRKGLVLEGGGAKGAYAFGWLLEFAARGTKFDAVAGTSVGALNALLWATDQIAFGEKLWRTISEETTLALRKPKWFWSLLVLPYAAHRAGHANLNTA